MCAHRYILYYNIHCRRKTEYVVLSALYRSMFNSYCRGNTQDMDKRLVHVILQVTTVGINIIIA